MKPTQEQVIAWAREAGIELQYITTPLKKEICMTEGSVRIQKLQTAFAIAYEAGRKDKREKVTQWMIQRSYATGHGDTTEDLLAELEWQVREAERNNMVATAAELGWALYGGDPFEDGVRDVAAIRARREQ